MMTYMIIIINRAQYIITCDNSIMYEANPSLKTSVKYTYTNDTRNDPVVPAIGGLMSWRYFNSSHRYGF